MSTVKEHNVRETHTREQLSRELASFTPRQRILAAALKLFVEPGYFNTNIPDLSRESHCSIGSIYHTFKNKEEIAAALYAEGIRAFREALTNALPQKCDEKGTLINVVKAFMLFSEVNHQLSKYIWLCRHHEFLDERVQSPTRVGFDKLGRTLTKSIRSGVKKGLLRELPAPILWSILFGTPLAYIRDWLDGYNPEPPSKVADEIADACWRALSVS